MAALGAVPAAQKAANIVLNDFVMRRKLPKLEYSAATASAGAGFVVSSSAQRRRFLASVYLSSYLFVVQQIPWMARLDAIYLCAPD